MWQPQQLGSVWLTHSRINNSSLNLIVTNSTHFRQFLYYSHFAQSKSEKNSGGCSCSESSMKYILNQRPSKGVLIMPGGTAEIQYSKPGSEYRIIKTRRKGFVRIALETGTPLVPVFTFGENNAFIPYKLLNTNIIKRLFGIDLFLLNGRGILQHNFGILPRNVPVTSIVGKPIPIPKVKHPTPELIDEYHEKFFEELHKLFEKYKIEYDNADGKSQLIML